VKHSEAFEADSDTRDNNVMVKLPAHQTHRAMFLAPVSLGNNEQVAPVALKGVMSNTRNDADRGGD
jgi:hypothetical protein